MAGVVVWKGPSRLDGGPIVVIATNNSHNVKTGDMIQTWILCENVNPVEALSSGADISICGNCPLRKNICYVNTGQAPLAVWRKYERGSYAPFNTKFFENQALRIGSYGDPCAVPLTIWLRLLQYTKNHTGYTHQWQLKKNQRYSKILMASIDDEREYSWARMLGWRSFRVKSPTAPKMSTEVICPASPEGGNKTVCARCSLCSGRVLKGKNIVIDVHGPHYKVKNYLEGQK